MVALAALAAACIATLIVVTVGLARRQQRLARQQRLLEAELTRLRQQSQGHGVGSGAVVAAAGVGVVVLGVAVVTAGALLGVALIAGAVIVGGLVVGGLVLTNLSDRRRERAIQAQLARWLAPQTYQASAFPGYCPGCAEVLTLQVHRDRKEAVR